MATLELHFGDDVEYIGPSCRQAVYSELFLVVGDRADDRGRILCQDDDGKRYLIPCVLLRYCPIDMPKIARVSFQPTAAERAADDRERNRYRWLHNPAN